MENDRKRISTKFRCQINSADEEIKKRNFHGVDGISNTVHPPFHIELRIGDRNVHQKFYKNGQTWRM